MQTELLSLSKAFTENLFRIPDYQRGYAWGNRQLNEFWADIDQLDDGKNHYTGVLTLESVPKRIFEKWDEDLWIIQSKNFRPYFVVDGQQRLTTAVILIMSILERVDADSALNYDTVDDVKKRFIFLSRDGGLSRSYIFGYEKDNPSYEFLKVNVFGEQSENYSLVEPTIYTKNLESAKSFFSGKLEGLDLSALERLYAKVTQNLLFNVFTISEDIDVHVTFETMNNRGKALSQLELLKNRLIYLSTKLPDSEADDHDRAALRRLVNESWKTAYHYLGKTRSRILQDDFFLGVQAHCYFSGILSEEELDRRIVRGGRYRGIEQGSYLLDKVFNVRRIQQDAEDRLTADALRKYALDVKSSVEVFFKIFNPADAGVSGEEKIWLERIRRISFEEAAALLMATYRARHSTSARVRLLTALERHLFFRNFSSYFFYQREFKLVRLASELASKKKTLTEVASALELINEDFSSSAEFIAGIKNLGRVRDYYRWSPTRYVLFEYEMMLQAQTRTNRSKLSWAEYSGEDWEKDYVTLEHVYPQQASHSEWKERFNSYSVAERNRLKNTIGNLTPLSKGRNSALGNKPFSVKRGDAHSKSGYCFGCYSEIEIAQTADWNPESILERGIRLLEFIEGRWGVELGDTKSKRDLLGLDFVSLPALVKKRASKVQRKSSKRSSGVRRS